MAKMTAAMAEKINRAHKLGYGIGRSGEAPSRYQADINAMNPQEKKYFQLGLIEGRSSGKRSWQRFTKVHLRRGCRHEHLPQH